VTGGGGGDGGRGGVTGGPGGDDEPAVAGVFLAGAFFAVVFLAAAFLAAAFFAVVFLAAAFLAAAFFAVVFLAAAFLAAAFFADDVPAAPRAAPAAARRPDAAARVADSAAEAAVAGTTASESPTRLRAFRAPLTTSLSSLPGRNFGMYFRRVFAAAPVLGLRAVPALRTLRSNAPKPVITTFSPLDTDRVITSTTESSACAATLRLPSNRSASSSMS